MRGASGSSAGGGGAGPNRAAGRAGRWVLMTIKLADIESAARRLHGHALVTPLIGESRAEPARGTSRSDQTPRCFSEPGRSKFEVRSTSWCGFPRRSAAAASWPTRPATTPWASRWPRSCWAYPAAVVVPRDAPKVKLDAAIRDGAEVHFYDRRTESREDIATALAAERGSISSCRRSTIARSWPVKEPSDSSSCDRLRFSTRSPTR